ncbi:uncharacterized conserved protein [Halothermothrix orenii H 168]|uniref:Uncharacterized conserved protein n=2 Tax=Halothermothrix orenii TaxID=31909 RepID=B8D156_HALOH|nr:uncharacterized conserved protein [Halothermothrix orenii H 168]
MEFKKIKNKILKYIGNLILSVEHVGSTSVEGLAAKPIIDIDVVIEDMSVLPDIIKGLEKAGYEYEGNLGIEGREAFRRIKKDGLMKHHLYVCPKDGKGYLEHIALRDYLRENKDARREYEELKLKLARKYRNDVDTYCIKKTDFINSILSKTIYKKQD